MAGSFASVAPAPQEMSSVAPQDMVAPASQEMMETACMAGEQVSVQVNIQNNAAPQQQVMAPLPPVGDIFGDAVIIRQQRAYSEMFGIEAVNIYTVENAAAGPMVLIERSNCVSRQCLGLQRAATINLHMGNTKKDPVIARFKKNCHANPECLCINWWARPSMDIMDVNGGKIGQVRDPCTFCGVNQTASDSQGNGHFYTQKGCQTGLCGVKFPVKNVQTGDWDGHIYKKCNGLCDACMDVNRFEVKFPSNSDVNAKTLLIGMAMLLDFVYFERGGGFFATCQN